MNRRKSFRPAWSEAPPPRGSYRSIFKFGDPAGFKHPSDNWYAMLKEALGMTDRDFVVKQAEGRAAVDLRRPPRPPAAR